MATFWLWGVRNLFVALAAVAAFAGYQQAADWSITLVVMLGFAMVAEVGNRFGRKAWRKKQRKQAAIMALRSASELRDRMRSSEHQRAA
jgi:hypothetical protein